MFSKWRNPCLLSVQRVCSFAYRVICRMSLLCSIFRTCLRPFGISRLATFAHNLNWSVSATNDGESTYSQNTANSGSVTCCNCGSLTVGDVNASITMQSQIWKHMVSFKRKLLGDSSVLPSSILGRVARQSRSVLSQQSNSAQMPDDFSCCSKRPKLEQKRSVMTQRNTVVVIPEDLEPHLNTAQEHSTSSASMDPASLLFEDELVALFDSDNQKETDASASTCASTSGGKSEFPPLLNAVYYCLYKLSVTFVYYIFCLMLTLVPSYVVAT